MDKFEQLTRPFFLSLVEDLEVGDFTIILDKDWKNKSTVSNYVRAQTSGKMKFSIKRLADNTGYAVKRTE
jgi:hypothetical protein